MPTIKCSASILTTSEKFWYGSISIPDKANGSNLLPDKIYNPFLLVVTRQESLPIGRKSSISNSDGNSFYHINFEKYKQNNHSLNVYIRTVKATGKKDSILFGGYFGNVNEDKTQAKNNIPSINNQWNSFHIEYSSPLFEQQSNIEYSYYLEGFDKDWSEWSKKNRKRLY